MVHVQAASVGAINMDNCKKEKHYLGSLEDHTVRKSASDMDGKLNEAGKKLNRRL